MFKYFFFDRWNFAYTIFEIVFLVNSCSGKCLYIKKNVFYVCLPVQLLIMSTNILILIFLNFLFLLPGIKLSDQLILSREHKLKVVRKWLSINNFAHKNGQLMKSWVIGLRQYCLLYFIQFLCYSKFVKFILRLFLIRQSHEDYRKTFIERTNIYPMQSAGKVFKNNPIMPIQHM